MSLNPGWRTLTGGKIVNVAAPLDAVPLYVRAGSIVPTGSDMEFATEKPADPIELRVYAGPDGDVTSYADEKDSCNYQKGAYAIVSIHWKDVSKQLTIGERKGSCPGTIKSRAFHVTCVGPGAEPAWRQPSVRTELRHTPASRNRPKVTSESGIAERRPPAPASRSRKTQVPAHLAAGFVQSEADLLPKSLARCACAHMRTF
jgi:hypothetical protein